VQPICIINRTTIPFNVNLPSLVHALQTHVSRDFAKVWNIDALLEISTEPLPGAWPIYLLDHSDVNGALGYHDAPNGVPVGKVFIGDDLKYNLSPTVTLCHELDEMLLDAYVNLGVQIGGTSWVANEACDPVEADRLGYQIDGFQMSDFLTPNWFEPSVKGIYDFGKHLTAPLQLFTGGYCSVWTPQGWTQKTHRDGPSVRAQRSMRHLTRANRPFSRITSKDDY
jgi:hypothetical protein